jgi:hypothetical protein
MTMKFFKAPAGLKIWLLASLILSCVSCSNDNEEELFAHEVCLSEEVSFSGFVKPLIDNRCSSCHNSALASGSVNLEDYQQLKQAINNGRFLGAIHHDPGFSPMPKGGAKLSDCDIEKIESWIQAGLPEN